MGEEGEECPVKQPLNHAINLHRQPQKATSGGFILIPVSYNAFPGLVKRMSRGEALHARTEASVGYILRGMPYLGDLVSTIITVLF